MFKKTSHENVSERYRERERELISFNRKTEQVRFFFQIECHGLNMNSPHMLIYLNTQSPVDKADC